MAVGTADLQESIVNAWTAAGLDAKFTGLWDHSDLTLWDEEGNPLSPVLQEPPASPKQPFPYCIMETEKLRPLTRMTGRSSLPGTKQHNNEVSVTFSVHAKTVKGDVRSSKQIAAYLVEEVMAVFGGHPTRAPSQLSLSNGGVLLRQYQGDFPVQEELYEYKWCVQYRFLVDVPVMV